MNLEEYLKNPCGISSIPYWKAKMINPPPNMRIVHDCIFSKDLFPGYEDTAYFRLFHTLEHIDETVLATEFSLDIIPQEKYPYLAELINLSYKHLGIEVDISQIEEWTKTEVYVPELWLALYSGNKMVGSVVADYDSTAKEGIIEWLQVLPEYRGQGLAGVLLNKCLGKMQRIADFVTVSGLRSNITNPESVYRKSGFTGDDIWHILIER